MRDEYIPINPSKVVSIELTSSTQSASSSMTNSQKHRQEVRNTYTEEFENFASLYDKLADAIEAEDRNQIFIALDIPNPYSGESNSLNIGSSYLENFSEQFRLNMERSDVASNIEYLIKGLSWYNNYSRQDAYKYAMQMAWLMYIPVEAKSVKDYAYQRAGGYLRDLNARYAPDASNEMGDRLEENVRNFIQDSGLPLNDRRFEIETPYESLHRVMDIPTELSQEPAILEAFTGMSSYKNKDTQVQNYADLYKRVEGQAPHIFHITDNPRTNITLSVLSLLIKETPEAAISPWHHPDREDKFKFISETEVDQDIGDLPKEVQSHELQIAYILYKNEIDYDNSLLLEATYERSETGRFGRTSTSTCTDYIPLGPVFTIEHYSEKLMFALLSSRRGEEFSPSNCWTGCKVDGETRLYFITVSEEDYEQGKTITRLHPNVLYGLLQAGVEHPTGMSAFM